MNEGAWNPVLALHPIDVRFHDVIETSLLDFTHRWHFCNHQLGVLGFDQVMQLQCGFCLPCRLPIQDAIAGKLGIVEMPPQWQDLEFYGCLVIDNDSAQVSPDR
ncbi:MAG: hypothetical protein QOD99_2008 [Chthoniobacter sp.]|nr:hypothetical protein [Chthoniobacter sp.]